jgi:hypothetical protein
MNYQHILTRLEAASAPDRKIDIVIAQATDANGYRIEDDGTILVSGDQGDGPGWFNIGYDVPAFTSSVDAALTLIPEGLFYLVGIGRVRSGEPLAAAQILRPVTLDQVAEAEADTLPIAICIAALKARDE